MTPERIVLRIAAACAAVALIGIRPAAADDLSLPPSGSAAGAFLTSSRTYPFATGPEERHFSYRIPQALADRPAGTVPVVLLLHGGVPTGTADEGFMGDFLDGLDETVSPGADFAYVSVRAARVQATRCLDLFQAGHLDESGRNACLDSALVGRQAWRFAGASASTGGGIDPPDAFTVDDPDAYVDVLALGMIVRDFADTFPSLDAGRVFIATFSLGSHVADQVICSRSSMVRGVASITGSWLTRSQFGADGLLGGADGATECGSGHEPGYAALTGAPSEAYGRRDAAGNPARRGGTLAKRIPVFRSLGLSDHNVTEGQTAAAAAKIIARLNGVENAAGKVLVLPDVDPATQDGKVITMASRQTPRGGETRNTAKVLVIGECGLGNRRGRPAFNPRKVPQVDGPGCEHGIWGKNDDPAIGTDQHWPQLAIQFFSRF